MKKISVIALVAVLLFVAVGTVAAKERTATSWEKFLTAISGAKSGDVVKLTKDIVCPAAGGTGGFSASDAKRIAIEVADGVIIDLNGKTITASTNALELIGKNFTIKNGKIDVTKAPINSGYYALTISADGYDGSSAYAADVSTTCSSTASKKVVIDGIEANGIFLCGVSAEVKNSVMKDASYRGLVFWGASGTVENCTISSKSTNGALVCKSSNDVVIKSNVTLSGSKALQLDVGCNVTIAADAKNVTIEALAMSGLTVDYPAPVYLVTADCHLEVKAPVTFKASYDNYIISDITKANNFKIADGCTFLNEKGAKADCGVLTSKISAKF